MTPTRSQRLKLLWALLVLASCASCAREAPSVFQEFVGTWIMKLGERTLMVVTLKDDGKGLSGTLSQPSFELSEGLHFSRVALPAQETLIVSGAIQNGRLHFVTADKDEYDMTLDGKDQASIQLDGPFEPFPLQRAATENAKVSTDWDPQRTYSPEDNLPSNPAMARIADEDQNVRVTPLSGPFPATLSQQDTERRNRTRKLLADGQLHTGDDFYRAALIFQHGSTPDDFLLAHTLALIAVAKGNSSAPWMGAATLDRYLHSIGKPQIYGTQFSHAPELSQEPFTRDLISDALRRQLGVPPVADQQKQFKLLEQVKPAKSN